MDILSFVVEMTKALAWPVAVVVISILFRQQVSALLQRLKRGKIGDAEFEFADEVKELQEATSPELPSPKPKIAEATFTLDPRAAILRSWLKVEEAVTTLAQKRQIAVAPANNFLKTLTELEKIGALSTGDVSLISGLRSLRNRAAHELDFNPPMDSIFTYFSLSAGAIKILQDASR